MDWEKLITQFGVSVAALFFLCWAMVAIARWFATEFLKPGIHRHFKLLDRVEGELESQTKECNAIKQEIAALRTECPSHAKARPGTSVDSSQNGLT